MIVGIIVGFSLWYVWKCIEDDRMERDPTVVRLKQMLIPTFPEIKNVKVMKGSSSYTVDKNKVYICTDYDNQKYDDNMLIYVMLHELAHVITPEIGHGKTFMDNFDELLQRATDAKLYDPELPKVKNYCNIT